MRLMDLAGLLVHRGLLDRRRGPDVPDAVPPILADHPGRAPLWQAAG